MIKAPVYLDYNSTTPVDARVLETMLPYFNEKFGNASSRTHAFGWIADDAVKQSRKHIADLIKCIEQEIVFTSGATEAANLAIKGVYENYQSKGNHIVTVATEHKAVLDTCKALEKKGAKITYLSVDRNGLINIQELENSITGKTILVSVMYANNETGVIQPIKEIAEIAHSLNCIFMSDATQAVGKIPIDITQEGIDLLCMSAHKMYGPKGIGALYVRRKSPRVSLIPQIDGGGQERGIRSGTLNVPGIVGLGKACEIALEEMQKDAERTLALRIRLEQNLLDLGRVFLNGSPEYRLAHTSNLSFEGIRSEELIKENYGIAVASGSACTSALREPSHVLKAMGLSDRQAYDSIRFSLGKHTTEEEIDYTIASVKRSIKLLRT